MATQGTCSLTNIGSPLELLKPLPSENTAHTANSNRYHLIREAYIQVYTIS